MTRMYKPKECPECGYPLLEVRHEIEYTYKYSTKDGTYHLLGTMPARKNTCPRCGHDLQGVLKPDIRVEQSPSRFTFGLRVIGETEYRGEFEVLGTNRLRAKQDAIEHFKEQFPELDLSFGISALHVELISTEGNE